MSILQWTLFGIGASLLFGAGYMLGRCWRREEIQKKDHEILRARKGERDAKYALFSEGQFHRSPGRYSMTDWSRN